MSFSEVWVGARLLCSADMVNQWIGVDLAVEWLIQNSVGNQAGRLDEAVLRILGMLIQLAE